MEHNYFDGIRDMKISWIITLVICLLLVKNVSIVEGRVDNSDQLQCKDENNQPVDWFVMYKIPKLKETSNPTIRNGIAYQYITSETVNSGWKLSNKDVTMKNSIAGNTLSPLYKDMIAGESIWVLYNDKAPDSNHSSAKYGHAKGIVMADSKKGFWLIHSVPSFPAVPRTGTNKRREANDDEVIGEYDYPESGRKNGQSFICISVNSDQIDVIARQLMYNQIVTYRKNLPKQLAKTYPIFANASNEARIDKPPYNRKSTLTSVSGEQFVTFAKSDKWQKDLYDDFVGPQLNSDLFAETWLNGRGKLPSECAGTQVLNVESVVLNEANVKFASTHDHSKWAISTTAGKNGNWICVGDINRADTQFSRGGGTVCLKSSVLWPNYRNAVNEVESCPRGKKLGFFGKIKNWFTTIL